MGWSIGQDSNGRDIGYGVPAFCDQPDCTTKIDRGLSYVCGGEAYGGDEGCGLFFCGFHLGYAYNADGDELLDVEGKDLPQMCECCVHNHENPDAEPKYFLAKPDHPEWVQHKLTDPSWKPWRDSHPGVVEYLRSGVAL